MQSQIESFDLPFRTYRLCGYRRETQGGTPVLFLHGGGLDSAMLSWREVIAMMPSEYDCYAVDLLGYGESDKPKLTYSVPFYSELVLSVLEELHLSSVHLVGLSLGGGIGIHTALTAPDRVRSLTLTDAWGLSKSIPFYALSRWYVHSSWNEASYRWTGKTRSRVRWLVSSSLFGDSRRIPDTLVDELYSLLQMPECGMSWQSLQQYELGKNGITTDLYSHLEELSLPVLIVNGDRDFGVPLKDASAAAHRIAGAELFVMKNAKHWAQKEYPKEYTERLVAFLNSALNEPSKSE